ncbi:MAG: nicotinamidase [Candidatus Eremiobacteraeota bacterium]|nr:nicotinamidase [Candidatus Eremiobacteraeota bacterium]
MATAHVHIQPTDALVIVDPQLDFLPGGPLAVADGNRIFEPINRLIPKFSHVLATRDWHPEDHAYFEVNGGIWPFHCIANTPGAEFSPLLDAKGIGLVMSKGTDPDTDGYSAFAGTDMVEQLRTRGIKRLFLCGLATDYCVKMTSLEAKENGFEAIVLTDAIAAVNLKSQDGERALAEMAAHGVTLALSSDLA